MKNISFIMASSFFKQHTPSFAKTAILLHQKKMIEQHYDFLSCKIKGNSLLCSGHVVSSDYQNEYHFEVNFFPGFEPTTKMISPTSIVPCIKIHMYSDRTLCLNYPPDMKWMDMTPIYKYTIPWIKEWTHYYELFLVNGGVWEGPESPCHITDSDKEVAY